MVSSKDQSSVVLFPEAVHMLRWHCQINYQVRNIVQYLIAECCPAEIPSIQPESVQITLDQFICEDAVYRGVAARKNVVVVIYGCGQVPDKCLCFRICMIYHQGVKGVQMIADVMLQIAKL